ncbi:transketolase [Gehongia tenuis]|uniref:Transketolase n=1 Tax=Gehongia tenuis TaxID=2763655 RepID=A0A926D3A4_9FIRM|nr:transketolase [Gehongia tenuis]MBC8530722.1 transketolase [Gehongia tenuis]
MNEADILRGLRKKIFLTACAGGGGHLASSFSSLEILYTLYARKTMNFRCNEPLWADRDRLILSKGHAALACYTVLSHVGFFGEDVLSGYAKPHSVLGGEPSGESIPGIETPTGSLGHGLSFGVGTALASKMSHADFETFVLLGDGECEEGSVWEAVIAASALKLGRLIAIVDVNGLQKMATVSEIAGISSWEDKWRSFGWDVVSVDGHDLEALTQILSHRRSHEDKPLAIVAKTVKGKGVSIMENNPVWHYRMPGKKELKTFMAELDISQEEVDHAKSIYQCAE